MSEIINWFISSELENKNYKQILMITKGDKTSWCMYKYDLTDFMEKYGFKSIEQLIDYLNKHIKERITNERSFKLVYNIGVEKW